MGFPAIRLGAPVPLRTQISGKYSPDNTGVFALKRQLTEAGLEVKFPVGDEIIEYSLGFAITVPHEAEVPFHTTEVNFFREVKANHLQVTYDVHCDNDGYVGESTAIETAYALLYNKPVIMVRPPTNYSAFLAPSIQEIIERYKQKMVTASIDQMPIDQMRSFIHQVAALKVDYGLTDGEREIIFREALVLTRKYQAIWQEYTRQS
jgi:hypothetical protein